MLQHKRIDGQIIDCDTIFESSIASLNEEFSTVIRSEELFDLLIYFNIIYNFFNNLNNVYFLK